MDGRLKIFIAEDDVFISEQLNDILHELGHEVTGIGYSFASSKKSLIQTEPDVAILDIKMHGEDQGLQIARFIREELSIPFLFLTSFSDEETVKKAGHLKPEAYIVKPFTKQDIYSNLSIVMMRSELKDETVLLKDGHNKIVLNKHEIRWVKADDKYLEIYTDNKKYVDRLTFGDLIADTDFLVRCHKSYVINIHQVASFGHNFVKINEQKIPVGRTYRPIIESS